MLVRLVAAAGAWTGFGAVGSVEGPAVCGRSVAISVGALSVDICEEKSDRELQSFGKPLVRVLDQLAQPLDCEDFSETEKRRDC